MSGHIPLIALCPYRTQAETAIRTLRRIGFDANTISVFGRIHASDEDVVGLCVRRGHLEQYGGGARTFWELMWELFGDGGVFIVPRVGTIAIAGSFASEFTSDIGDHPPCRALTALGDALCRLGIPQEIVLRYEIDIRASECALLAFGTLEQVAAAKAILYSIGITDFIIGKNSEEHGGSQELQTELMPEISGVA